VLTSQCSKSHDAHSHRILKSECWSRSHCRQCA